MAPIVAIRIPGHEENLILGPGRGQGSSSTASLRAWHPPILAFTEDATTHGHDINNDCDNDRHDDRDVRDNHDDHD